MKKLLTLTIALMTGIAMAAPDGEKKAEGAKGKGKPEKGAFFKKLAGDDDKISEEEWANSPMAKKAKEAGKGDAVAARFKKMDADGDGSVTKEEFAKAMMGRAKGKGKGKGQKPEGGKGKKDKKAE